MGPIGCPEPSVRNYKYPLRNIPEERSSYPFRGASLHSSHITDYLHRQTDRQLLLAIYFLFALLHPFSLYPLSPFRLLFSLLILTTLFTTAFISSCPTHLLNLRRFILTDLFLFLPFILSVLLQCISPPPPPHFTKFSVMDGSDVQ